MGAVTYPDPTVISFLNRHFACLQVNTGRPTAEGRELLRRHRLLWEPGFVLLDSRLNELRRTVGYLSPDELVAELRIGLGKRAILRRRHPEALEHFWAAAARPSPAAAPEALFWAGIAEYRIAGNDLGTLERCWAELARRFPETTWSARADVFDARVP